MIAFIAGVALLPCGTAFAYNPPQDSQSATGGASDTNGGSSGTCGDESDSDGSKEPSGDSDDGCACECSGEGQKTDAPDFLPTLGDPVKLEMISGGNSKGLLWGRQIGFGGRGPLNYLTKVHLTTDLRFARVYVPRRQSLVAFERDTGWTYRLADNEVWFGEDSVVEFVDADADGQPETATLTFPSKVKWFYEFECFNDNANSLPGMAFRTTGRESRDGYQTTVSHNADNVTITDASGQDYVCALDVQDRITGIAVNGATWSYAYDGDTVTETNPRTGATTATTVMNHNMITVEQDVVVSVVIDGGDGAVSATTYEYDVNGFMTRRVRNGVETTVEITDYELYGNNTRVETTGGITRTTVYSPLGVVSKADGLGNETTFELDRRFRANVKIDPMGNTWRNFFDDNGYKTRVEDPDGGWTDFVYDASYNLLSRTTPSGTA